MTNHPTLGLLAASACLFAGAVEPIQGQRAQGTTPSGLTGTVFSISARGLPAWTWSAGLSLSSVPEKAVRERVQGRPAPAPVVFTRTIATISGGVALGSRTEVGVSLAASALSSPNATQSPSHVWGSRFEGGPSSHGLSGAGIVVQQRVFGSKTSVTAGTVRAGIGWRGSGAAPGLTLGKGWASVGTSVEAAGWAASADFVRPMDEDAAEAQLRIASGYSWLLFEPAEILLESSWTLSIRNGPQPPDRWRQAVGLRYWFGTYREWVAVVGATAHEDATGEFLGGGVTLSISYFPRYEILARPFRP